MKEVEYVYKQQTIEFAKISKITLEVILFAARWQLNEWQSKGKPNEIYQEAIKQTKYLTNYMKHHDKPNYLLYENIHEY